MVDVLASTTAVPELVDGLHRRRVEGRHAADEWEREVYHLAGPHRPEQGAVVARLIAYLLPLADALGLQLAASATIGRPGRESRVPSITVFDVGSPRTTQASLSTAELVVDVVDHGSPGGDRLHFYERWRVREVLTVDLGRGTLTLRRATPDGWELDPHSQVLGFDVEDGALTSLRGRLAIGFPTV